ncbi:MAG TPA: hypothetical protein VGG09_14825 [Acidimicrobiales bacterium]|jgi:hypothetical protein
MPTVSIKSDASKADLASAIKVGLGSGYEVEPASDKEVITVRKGTMTTAHVKLDRSPDGAKAHVHGGGFIISRIVNELGIANSVAKTIKSSALSA